MRRNLTGLVVVLAVLGAGVAYAAASSPSKQTPRQAFLSDVAKRLGVSTAKLQAALQGAFDDRLSAAVAAGRLTSAQASAIKQRLSHSAQFGVGPALPFPMAAPVTPMGNAVNPAGSAGKQYGAVPGTLPRLPGRWSKAVCRAKVTVPAPAGSSTTTTSPSGSTTTTTAAPPTSTSTTPAGGPGSSTTTVVTPGGSATIVTHGGSGAVVIRHGFFRIWRSWRPMVVCDVHWARLGFGAGIAGGFAALAGGFRAVSAYLGLTPAKLISELRSGRSLSQIASAQGKTLGGLRSALLQQLHRRLDRLVAAGTLTKAQAKLIMSRRSALERAVLSGKATAKFDPALHGAWGRHGRAFRMAPWMAGATPGP